MRQPGTTAPFIFFFLVLPSGISNGFVSITLPFILTQNGFPVATSASIVALGLSANLWRFLWGPVADLTLTARRWYLIGLAASVVTLIALGFIPFRQSGVPLLTAVAFISQVAATLIMLPVGGLMAHTVPEEQKGRAAGRFQAGNLGGTGLGGGAGVWLAAHYSKRNGRNGPRSGHADSRGGAHFCLRCPTRHQRANRPTHASVGPRPSFHDGHGHPSVHYCSGCLPDWLRRHE